MVEPDLRIEFESSSHEHERSYNHSKIAFAVRYRDCRIRRHIYRNDGTRQSRARMDSTAADSRNPKRARLAPTGGVDRLSGLDDDVLLHILGLVGDARDAVRTGALSRRWRGLWTRVPELRFASRSVSTADLERYISFVDGVLARRAQSGCAIESLAISYASAPESLPANQRSAFSFSVPFYTDLLALQLMPACVDAAQGWIRYALQHSVRSLDVDLSLPPAHPKRWSDHGVEKPAVFLGEQLPTSPARLEALRLALGGAKLRLSAASVQFASLTDLSLERIAMPAGGVRLLARLVSPASCPQLRKLRMRKICLDASDKETMRLETEVLSELLIEDVQPLMSLELRTPSLRVLHIYSCPKKVLRISAPRLEEIALFFQPLPPPRRLDIDGDLPCVRRVQLCLWSYRDRFRSRFGDAENNSSAQLLKNCSSITCLDVTLEGPMECDLDLDIINGRVPHLPQVTSLTIKVSITFFKRHEFGASVASLLTRFNNLRHLSLHLPSSVDPCYNLCDHPNHWKFIEHSMGHLQEAELMGLTGTDCELWFIEAMLTSTKRLRSVSISFNPYYRQPQYKMDALERLLLGVRMYASQRDAFTLTCIREI